MLKFYLLNKKQLEKCCFNKIFIIMQKKYIDDNYSYNEINIKLSNILICNNNCQNKELLNDLFVQTKKQLDTK